MSYHDTELQKWKMLQAQQAQQFSTPAQMPQGALPDPQLPPLQEQGAAGMPTALQGPSALQGMMQQLATADQNTQMQAAQNQMDQSQIVGLMELAAQNGNGEVPIPGVQEPPIAPSTDFDYVDDKMGIKIKFLSGDQPQKISGEVSDVGNISSEDINPLPAIVNRGDTKIASPVENPKKGKKLSRMAIWRMAAYKQGFNQIKHLADLKIRGFAGKGIDTGPVAQYYPQTASSYIAGIMGTPPRSQGDRSKLESATLWFMNPIRKEVTGAQAAIEELREFIMPMMPQMSDNEPNWNAKAIEVSWQLANQYQTFVNELRRNGYNVPGKFNSSKYLQEIDKSVYGNR